jgi:hypothetical protein
VKRVRGGGCGGSGEMLRFECAVSELFLSLRLEALCFLFFSLFSVRDGHAIRIYPFAIWGFESVM